MNLKLVLTEGLEALLTSENSFSRHTRRDAVKLYLAFVSYLFIRL